MLQERLHGSRLGIRTQVPPPPHPHHHLNTQNAAAQAEEVFKKVDLLKVSA